MEGRRLVLLLLLAAMALGLTGCAGVSTHVQNPPLPATAAVSIVFQPAPPASVAINASALFTAVVTNDSSGSGVDWSLSCPNKSNCGSLSSLHTASGQPVTYSPPSALGSNSQSTTIVAFATADHSRNVESTINVSAFGSALQGTYVLQTSGVDISGFPYQRAGVVVLDGNGHLTSGERTVNFVDPTTGMLASVSDVVTGGSYFVGADGRGTLALNTANVNVGQQGTCGSGNSVAPCGVETLSLVVLSKSQALLTKMDDPSLSSASNESSTGRMDLQTSQSAPRGGYAFVTRGTDINSAGIGIGGVLNVDAPNTISGAGSTTDLVNNDGSGLVTVPNSPVSGTVTAPDSLGAVQISLTTGFGLLQFAGYVIDTSRIVLIESDDSAGAGFGLTAGVALAQGSATGTFTTSKSFSGSYAFGIFGQDSSGAPFSSLSSAGTFSASGLGTLNKGFLDEFLFEGGGDVQVSDAFHGTYTVDPAGTGRVDTNSSITFSHAVNGTGPELVFYLTGKGGQALVLDADSEPALGGAGIGTGIAYPVATGGSFAGPYGLISTENFSGATEVDSVGEIGVNGSARTLSGTLDMNNSFSATPNTTLTGGFQTTGVTGRLLGSWADQFLPIPNLSIAYYPIDSTRGWFVENDGGANGANPGNMTFGYYAARTPVCQGCP